MLFHSARRQFISAAGNVFALFTFLLAARNYERGCPSSSNGAAGFARLTVRDRRASLQVLTNERSNQRLLVARRSNLLPTPVGAWSESVGQKEIRCKSGAVAPL